MNGTLNANITSNNAAYAKIKALEKKLDALSSDVNANETEIKQVQTELDNYKAQLASDFNAKNLSVSGTLDVKGTTHIEGSFTADNGATVKNTLDTNRIRINSTDGMTTSTISPTLIQTQYVSASQVQATTGSFSDLKNVSNIDVKKATIKTNNVSTENVTDLTAENVVINSDLKFPKANSKISGEYLDIEANTIEADNLSLKKLDVGEINSTGSIVTSSTLSCSGDTYLEKLIVNKDIEALGDITGETITAKDLKVSGSLEAENLDLKDVVATKLETDVWTTPDVTKLKPYRLSTGLRALGYYKNSLYVLDTDADKLYICDDNWNTQTVTLDNQMGTYPCFTRSATVITGNRVYFGNKYLDLDTLQTTQFQDTMIDYQNIGCLGFFIPDSVQVKLVSVANADGTYPDTPVYSVYEFYKKSYQVSKISATILKGYIDELETNYAFDASNGTGWQILGRDKNWVYFLTTKDNIISITRLCVVAIQDQCSEGDTEVISSGNYEDLWYTKGITLNNRQKQMEANSIGYLEISNATDPSRWLMPHQTSIDDGRFNIYEWYNHGFYFNYYHTVGYNVNFSSDTNYTTVSSNIALVYSNYRIQQMVINSKEIYIPVDKVSMNYPGSGSNTGTVLTPGQVQTGTVISSSSNITTCNVKKLSFSNGTSTVILLNPLYTALSNLNIFSIEGALVTYGTLDIQYRLLTWLKTSNTVTLNFVSLDGKSTTQLNINSSTKTTDYKDQGFSCYLRVSYL